MKFNLDFSIYSSKDRLEAIKTIDLKSLNKTELETVTNYILYGKDEDGTSIVDRKEIYIKTKFNTYQKNRTTSLEGLMESPTFDENIFKKNRTMYKKVKPSIDKNKVKDIPEMVQLWKEIERLKDIQDQNLGKKEWTEGTPKLDRNQMYYLKHQLANLYSQQYYIWDSVNPTIMGKKNKAEWYDDDSEGELEFMVLPRGLMQKQNDKEFMEPRLDKERCSHAAAQVDEECVVFDFRKQEHLYQLIQFYIELKNQAWRRPNSLINNLLWTLDFYIEKAGLSPQQKLIVEGKKCRLTNKEIKQKLIEELGIEHKENYISTIWSKSIELIVKAVELNYDEFLCKDYDKAWKKCNRCGKMLLRDPRNFVRKSISPDGLTNRCKACDREMRQSRVEYKVKK